MFEERFDVVFNNYVETETFRLPLSVKELRLFCLNVCRSLMDECFAWQSGGQSQSLSSSNTESNGGDKPNNINVPIGFNSLSKTFNILKIVGKGNFGRVFKAENKFDHRLFALKQIPITPREDLSKVLQEVENLSKAGKHKNIVKYLDCFLIQEEREVEKTENNSEDSYSSYRNSPGGETSSASFINFHDSVSGSDMREVQLSGDAPVGGCGGKVLSMTEPSHLAERPPSTGYSTTLSCICIKMEFCDFTLDQLLTSLKNHGATQPSAQALFVQVSLLPEFKDHKINAKFGIFSPLFIIRQLLEGLSFIHQLGIVHRDLKPANIFIMNNGNVKIGDFGLSKDLSKESGISRLYAAGTRFYMAPEFSNIQYMGDEVEEDIVYPSSDMYSFGMVLVKMLGFLMFHDSEMIRFGDKIRRNSKKEIIAFLKQDLIEDLAVGTTQGNLSKNRRSIYLPVLLSFLEALLTSVLDIRPKRRLTALEAKQMVEDIFSEIFCGNDFFRPKIGAK